MSPRKPIPSPVTQSSDVDPAAVTLTVGIGASAGGLEAFRSFFSAMPTDTGMAFVLIQHLDPDYASSLVEILRNSTAMKVSQARDGLRVEPNEVFVIPPDSTLRIEGGVLRVTQPVPTAARRASINTFLTSLAEDRGETAVGIILSGFGADGAQGCEAIKEHGGLTLAQAEFDHAPKSGMPQSASTRGFVDHVLPVEAMPEALLDHWRFLSKTAATKGPDGVRQDTADHLGAICAVLNSRLGRDFSQYKTNTLMRRVQRRMQVLQLEDVPAYIDQLRERPDEPELLFREVLIRVTRFFRDPGAFEALDELIAAMLARGDPQDTVRVWVPGCATGEEAYSLAILFKEAMAKAAQPRKVQIFATDIDDQAIELARAGLFPDTIAADVPEELMARHFTKEGDRRRISKDIRQMCLFSVHDLVKDPPFSKLDLISCRNLLIYFGPELQKRVISMFHYGLRSGGALLLGASEAVAAHANLFSAVDKKHRVFARRDAQTPLTALTTARPVTRRVDAPERLQDQVEPDASQLMARHIPAFVIIDGRQQVRQFSGSIAKYLEPTTGAASLSLGSLVHTNLRAALREAIKKAVATQTSITDKYLVVEIGGHREMVNLIVEPLPDPVSNEMLFVVGFQDLGPVRGEDPAHGASPADANMVDELTATRERLQTLTEELETANEELQSSNEEYQSVNEEFQSANEELETSKEELQSINEELATVNAELNVRNDSLVDVNSDLVNLIDSTSIATLFLDRDLRIKRFTPTVLEIFNVRDGDEGRPITDIVSHLARDGLEHDVRQVVRTLVPVEREVTLVNGHQTYQMQVRPYRGINDVINGVVITFVDISTRKAHELDRAELAAIISSSDDAIFGHDPSGLITSWNSGARSIYGYEAEAVIGQPMTLLLDDPQAVAWPGLLARLAAGEAIRDFDFACVAKGGRAVEVSMTLSPIRDADGEVIGVSAIGRDTSHRKRAERQAKLLLAELDHRVKNILAVVSSVVSQTLKTRDSPEVFAEKIGGRIKAIAKAHNLVTEYGGAGASLQAIIRTELAPHDIREGRLKIGGPDVMLTPGAGLPIAMAIHELTTNAAKYGALSVDAGRLTVMAECLDDNDASTLQVSWTEEGGPPVEQPRKEGFGTSLIEKTLAYQFDAVVERVFAPEGLRCVIRLPLTHEVGQLADADDRQDGPT